MSSLHSYVAANKRKSGILIFVVLALVIGVVAMYSYYVRGDFFLPVVAALFAIPSTLIGYYSGDKIALRLNRAQRVPPEALPELHNSIENLAITAGTPPPHLYVIDSPALNAFATGRDPQHASVAVTTGLLAALDRSELEGVLAHELSHIRNYDIRYATLVAIFVGFLTILSDFFLRMTLWGGMGNRDSDNRDRGQMGALLAVIGLILLIISPLIAKLIQLAVSRQREYLADASGALLTRYPEGLARALEKISDSPPLQTAAQATAHLFIANPFRGKKIAHLFATHPPLEDRVRRLRASS